MTSDADDIVRIREMRQRGLTPKQIARAVGLPPSRITAVIRELASAEVADASGRPVVECWVSLGWSEGLTVDGRPEWPDSPAEIAGSSGLVGVLVARDAGPQRVSVCAWLVDVYCLGVKNDLGPSLEYRSSMPAVVRNFFGMFGGRPVAAPLELARHLVLGAVDYARSLGFEPAPEADFADTRGHLGGWQGPSAIGFGRDGKPFYVSGPHDDARRVLRQLERSVGTGNFDYLVGMPG